MGLLQPLRLLGSPALRPDLRDTLNGFIRDRDCLIPRILQYITIPWIIKTILPPVTALPLLVSLIPCGLVPEEGLKPAGNRIAQGLPVPLPLAVVPQPPGPAALLLAVGVNLPLGAGIPGDGVALKAGELPDLPYLLDRKSVV